ncbi:histone-lysine N-methyltransferase PRDM9-like isoform X2 [Portunus trituberculatus]|nr:histone-lysine N-methyltransferase PRDM9-like isoform X2 [Portunus trituberculatus]XP_045137591.1 histone-lysine N-methyltransferase PRDM9-like isoform X2 [Portunus trituberculatus]XP_045137592.1 histone-lysine N-methyltransferase PRDM9-like isoform X2 [Portunus trituberculatus]
MGDERGLFQQLINSFEAFLSEAQAGGQVEKYVLEVVVGKEEVRAVLHSALYTALVSLLHTLQEILENCYAEKKQNLSSVACSLNPGQYEHSGDDLPRLTESGSQEEKVVCKTPVSQPLHCLSPPLQPTTKETEAANVLMNLSGKATDRGTQPILESCSTPHHSHHSGSRPQLYSCPPMAPGRKDLSSRREPVPCDEVPQINEKDLLPLATQVLCQFCSRQCEDLVELHEHVLAAHHTAEADASLTVPQRKAQTSFRVEEDDGIAPVDEQEQRLEPADSDTSMIVLFPQPSTSHNFLEKKSKRSSKFKKEAFELSNEGITTEECSQQEEDCVNDWQSSVVVDSSETQPDWQSSVVVDSSETQPELPPPTLSTNNLCDKDQDWLKGQACRSVTELTPVASGDALAMAVESSQIRVLETKITIQVCLECSSGFTDPQDYTGHVCVANRPLVYRGSDGSVTLADVPPGTTAHQLQTSDMRLFPEFFVQQTVEGGVRGLQVVHLSGRTLRLHTNCPLSYLGDQLISFRCPTCENDSDSLTRFLDHLITGPCMFRCPDCQLVYISLDKLKKHRASLHPSLEDRTCPNCHHVFEKRHQRNKHLKTKCSQRHECVVCNRLLKNEYSLRVHMQSHEEERKHVCKDCGAAFHRQAILTRHKMRHTGTKPHACPQCDSHFYTRQHLRTHLDRHNGLRRFPCSTCNKAYYSKHDRDTHYSKVHCKTHPALKAQPTLEVRSEHVTE